MLATLLVRLFFSSAHALRMRARRGDATRTLWIALHAAYQHEHGSSIAWNAQFAGEPCFPHGERGIFVSGGAKIGRNCVIFQQVTIGSNTVAGSRGFGSPVIGDDCYIGAGAKIIGKVRIGDRVRIAANATVLQDVPDDSVVVTGPPELRTTRRNDNRFYSWRDGGWAYFDDGVYRPVTDPQVLASLGRGSSPPSGSPPLAAAGPTQE
jgi:serine O-acetyltransferase